MRVVVIALAVLGLALTGSVAATAPPAASGLRGVVLRGLPVCRDNDSCEEPAVGIVLVFSRSGRPVARVRTRAAGRYAVRLPPGTYAVTTPRARVGTGLRPRLVRVPKGRVVRVDFHLDTGIQ
jgi:hypothetical protein